MRIISTDHTHVVFTDEDDRVFDIHLPVQIGGEEGQVPQHVADALVGVAKHEHEYEIVEDEAVTPASKTPRGKAAKASAADGD